MSEVDGQITYSKGYSITFRTPILELYQFSLFVEFISGIKYEQKEREIINPYSVRDLNKSLPFTNILIVLCSSNCHPVIYRSKTVSV